MGDVTHIYDTNGALKAHYIYDAWGNHRIYDVNGDEVTKSMSDHIGNINPIRYRGYYYDDYENENGLYYLEARYYDPETGRFISQDSIDFLVPNHLTGLNLYAYCNNNPVMYSDPNGCFAFTTAMIIGLIAGAVIGGTLGGVSAYQSAKESGKSGWELAGATLLGVGTGAILGAGVGVVATAGTPYLMGGLASLGSKLIADTVAYTTFEKPFGSWEDYAISFVFGGLTKGLGLKGAGVKGIIGTSIDVGARPAISQLVKMGTRGKTWSTDKYAYDVIVRATAYGMPKDLKPIYRGFMSGFYWRYAS